MTIGDKVQWLTSKRTRSGYSFTMKEARIVGINDTHATVKVRGGHLVIPLGDLQVVGSGPNQLTKLMRGDL